MSDGDITQAAIELGRAKGDYINKLKNLDATLRRCVSEDPDENLAACQALQAEYTTGIVPETLAASEQ